MYLPVGIPESDIVALLRMKLQDRNGPMSEETNWEFYAFFLIENSAPGLKEWETYFRSSLEPELSQLSTYIDKDLDDLLT